MVKPMNYRDVQRKLIDNGCVHLRTTGSHERWLCPCGQHRASIPRHATVSPGVIRNTVKALPCLPKGWMQ